jgi:hypothetical protein
MRELRKISKQEIIGFFIFFPKPQTYKGNYFFHRQEKILLLAISTLTDQAQDKMCRPEQ